MYTNSRKNMKYRKKNGNASSLTSLSPCRTFYRKKSLLSQCTSRVNNQFFFSLSNSICPSVLTDLKHQTHCERSRHTLCHVTRHLTPSSATDPSLVPEFGAWPPAIRHSTPDLASGPMSMVTMGRNRHPW